MKAHINYVVFFMILFLLSKIIVEQENFAVNISKSISEDGKLLVTYDIPSDAGPGSFTVIMLITYEGKQVKASAAYGDIGPNVTPGKEKAIVWYYKDDLDGDIDNVNVDIFAYKENEPQAIFRIISKSNNGYAPCEISFENSSSYANEYQWDFGDPASGAANISFDKDPVHTYRKGGIYSITLVARNTQLNLENRYYQSIEINEYDPTIADFQIEGNNQLPTAKVDFINNSVNADIYKIGRAHV